MLIRGHRSIVRRAQPMPSRQEDPFSLMAYKATRCLLESVAGHPDAGRIGLTFANCMGGWTFCQPQAEKLVAMGPRVINSYMSTAWFPAAAQGQTTIKLDLQVPALTFSSHGTAFIDALVMADRWLRYGVTDMVVAVASESCGSSFLSTILGPRVWADAAVCLAVTRGDPVGDDWAVSVAGTAARSEGQDSGYEGDAYRGTSVHGACAVALAMVDLMAAGHGQIEMGGSRVVAADQHLTVSRVEP